MLANNYWAGNILSESDNSSTIKVPFTIGKWIFLACIIVSFLLLAWESRKARMIIRSRDISYAFTNIMANDYYSLKSYDHFCFFSQINNSKKKKDEFAFFVFFTFKGESMQISSLLRSSTVLSYLSLYCRLETPASGRCTSSSHQRLDALLFWESFQFHNRFVEILQQRRWHFLIHSCRYLVHYDLHSRNLGWIRHFAHGSGFHVYPVTMLCSGQSQGVLLSQNRQEVRAIPLSNDCQRVQIVADITCVTESRS